MRPSAPQQDEVSGDSTSPAMALTIQVATSHPIPLDRSRRPSRMEVTNKLLEDIADASMSPQEHNLMRDDSIVLDKDGGILNESTQGAYVMKRRATGVPVGVFKPMDEELLNMNMSPKLGVVAGDAAIKEHAAYVLDHGGRANVPRTETVVLMENTLELDSMPDIQQPFISPTRLGSFQEFREHTCTSEDLGSSLFPVEDVHFIGLLDLRLFNLDRHVGNILVQSITDADYTLVPIDHGYILPSFRCLSDAWFCWTSWRQSQVPFSENAKDYVRSLNPFRDIVQLKRIGLRDECILTYVLCTVFVKECVEHSWTLHRMALSMQRDVCRIDENSEFESLVKFASSRANFDSFAFKDGAESWGCPSLLSFLDAFEDIVQKFVVDPLVLSNEPTGFTPPL